MIPLKAILGLILLKDFNTFFTRCPNFPLILQNGAYLILNGFHSILGIFCESILGNLFLYAEPLAPFSYSGAAPHYNVRAYRPGNWTTALVIGAAQQHHYNWARLRPSGPFSLA